MASATESQEEGPLEIGICGAGPAGLLVAIGLAQNGHKVVIRHQFV